MVTIKDFKRFQIIIAEIKDVIEHPNADKLYVIKVNTGQEEKQVVAGIRDFYKKEDLIGRQVVVLNNIESAVIRGEESQGMILAVGDDEGLALVSLDRQVSLGSVVR